MEDGTGDVIATTRGDKAGFSLNEGAHGLKPRSIAVSRATSRGLGRSGRDDETNPDCDEAWTSRPPESISHYRRLRCRLPSWIKRGTLFHTGSRCRITAFS